jgi:hypothetical protein
MATMMNKTFHLVRWFRDKYNPIVMKTVSITKRSCRLFQEWVSYRVYQRMKKKIRALRRKEAVSLWIWASQE